MSDAVTRAELDAFRASIQAELETSQRTQRAILERLEALAAQPSRARHYDPDGDDDDDRPRRGRGRRDELDAVERMMRASIEENRELRRLVLERAQPQGVDFTGLVALVKALEPPGEHPFLKFAERVAPALELVAGGFSDSMKARRLEAEALRDVAHRERREPEPASSAEE